MILIEYKYILFYILYICNICICHYNFSKIDKKVNEVERMKFTLMKCFMKIIPGELI